MKDRYADRPGELEHPANVSWQPLRIDKEMRCSLMRQRPVVIWFTGLSGSGKSSIANELEAMLHAGGKHTILLDGDNVRHGLNRDLGFTESDRIENIRRVAEVSRLMLEAGLIVIVSFISPFRCEREMARQLMGCSEFIEVFVDTPFEICAQRDPKGLYARAFLGEIRDFTGLDSPYEIPEAPEIHLKTVDSTPRDHASEIKMYLQQRGV